MGSCYSDDHIAGDHIHTDITTCNIEEHSRSTALERSVIDNWGGGREGERGGGIKYVFWILKGILTLSMEVRPQNA